MENPGLELAGLYEFGMTRWESSRCEDSRRLQRRNAKCRLRRFESIPPAGRGRVVAARQLPPRYGDQSPSLAGRPDPNPYRGQAGESIHIQASDDFQIADVEVSITDASGAVLERGAATPLGDGAGWNYITTTSL